MLSYWAGMGAGMAEFAGAEEAAGAGEEVVDGEDKISAAGAGE
jgi:hypothetical protein